MIRDIAFTVYPSADVAGTRAWYEEKLGLVFAGPYEEGGVEKYNEAHIGNGCFSLMVPEWVEREPGSGSSVVFEVDDVDGAIRELSDRNIETRNFFDGPVCRQISLSDPEGNKITLHQRKPRPV